MKKNTPDLNQHYRQLLGLSDPWVIINVDLKISEKRIEISIEWPDKYMVQCPVCSKHCAVHDHREEKTWRHLDTMQFQTIIKSRVPRSNCPTHGIKTINVPWAEPGSRFTALYEHFAIDVILASKSIKDAAILLGISWDQVHHLQKVSVLRGLARRQLKTMKYMGLDEKSFLKGQKYVSIMVDIEGERVVDIVKDRTLESANELWSKLPEKVRKNVDAVAMDMWPAFITATKENAPQADIVHDKFHISKYLNEAVNQVRSKEHKELMRGGDESLKGKKYYFLKKLENMNPEELYEFKNIRLDILRTGRAWSIKELFSKLWDYSYKGSAQTFFNQWYWWATHSRLKPIIKVAKMIKKHFANIITYVDHRITNALVEGFNSKIQSVKANARGFRNFKNYRLAILFYCGKLNLYPQ